MATYETKTPDEVKDYQRDWSVPLGEDTIESSAWVAVPETLDLGSIPATFADRSTRVWLSGGEPGTAYAITNTITTRGGRTFQQTFYCDAYQC